MNQQEIEAMEDQVLIYSCLQENAAYALSGQVSQECRALSGEILRRLAERRTLLAQQPKVWTLETIKDAPEGEYACGSDNKWIRGIYPRKIAIDELHDPQCDMIWGPIQKFPFTQTLCPVCYKNPCIGHNQ